MGRSVFRARLGVLVCYFDLRLTVFTQPHLNIRGAGRILESYQFFIRILSSTFYTYFSIRILSSAIFHPHFMILLFLSATRHLPSAAIRRHPVRTLQRPHSYRFNHTRLPKKKKMTLKVTKLTSCMNFRMIQTVIKCFERSTVERIEKNSNDVSRC